MKKRTRPSDESPAGGPLEAGLRRLTLPHPTLTAADAEFLREVGIEPPRYLPRLDGSQVVSEEDAAASRPRALNWCTAVLAFALLLSSTLGLVLFSAVVTARSAASPEAAESFAGQPSEHLPVRASIPRNVDPPSPSEPLSGF